MTRQCAAIGMLLETNVVSHFLKGNFSTKIRQSPAVKPQREAGRYHKGEMIESLMVLICQSLVAKHVDLNIVSGKHLGYIKQVIVILDSEVV